MIDGIPVTGTNQPPISMAIYGHFFFPMPCGLRSWVEAEKLCAEEGLQLATPHSREDVKAQGGHPMRGGAIGDLRLGNHSCLG